MSFIEERLLDKVAYGSKFGQEFNTSVIEKRNGSEQRNAEWDLPRGRYKVAYDLLQTEDDHHCVRQAFMACRGSLNGFRFKDFTDFKVKTPEKIGTGDGGSMTLQLVKRYKFGNEVLERIITKPVAGSVKVYENGVLIPHTLDTIRGLVSIIGTTAGSTITYTGEFDVPVRFNIDSLTVSPITKNGKGGFFISTDVDLIELKTML